MCHSREAEEGIGCFILMSGRDNNTRTLELSVVKHVKLSPRVSIHPNSGIKIRLSEANVEGGFFTWILQLLLSQTIYKDPGNYVCCLSLTYEHLPA